MAKRKAAWRTRLEGWLARGVYFGLRRLPVNRSSDLVGGLFRLIGPRLGVSRIARRNLARAFPEKSEAEREAILRGMWENLGRTAGEFPHLEDGRFYAAHCDVVGAEHIRALRDDGKGGLTFSAHLGNWEMANLFAGAEGLVMHRFYRAANNPAVEDLFRRARGGAPGEVLPKGAAGARRAFALLKKGEHLGMLVDQKLNEGIPVPFFGRDAMTTTSIAQFALRLDLPVVPGRVVRTAPHRLRVEIYPPMELPRTGDLDADVRELMTRINAMIEGWIREHPDQWLWLHRRWPD